MSRARTEFFSSAPPPSAGDAWRDDRRASRFVVELPRVLDADQCDLLLSYITVIGQVDALVGTEDGAGSILDPEVRRVRQTVIRHTTEMSWIYETIAKTVDSCNRENFGFDLRDFNEDLVIVDYREGDFYNWHLDVGVGAISRSRKLSFSIVLSSPEEYEGGGLTFPGTQVDRVPRGGGVVFPSYLLHGVQPVKRGRRCALLAWIGGPRFQ